MNILIYVFDSLRADHLSCYGYERETTPNIDALAQDGIIFERAYAQATWTRPSAGTLLTGLYPSVHGAQDMFTGLRPEVPRLPQVLQQAGYQTAILSTIAQISPDCGFDVGVDHFVELYRGSALSDRRTFTSQADSLPDESRVPRSDKLAQLGKEWLSQVSKPFFALMWSIDTHVPFLLPPRGGQFAASPRPGQLTGSIRSLREAKSAAETRRMIDLYDSLIHSNDQNFGEIISYLKASGQYDETLIVVMSDHGEVFNEYGRLSHTGAAPWLVLLQNAPGLRKLLRRYRLLNPYGWLGHLDVLPYEEVLRVPLIVKLPHQARADQRVCQEVGIIDIAPTFYDLIEQHPEDAPLHSLQGVSLAPLMHNGSISFMPRYLFSDSQTHSDSTRYLSVQDENWKLIRLVHTRKTLQERWRTPAKSFWSWLERSSGNDLLFRRGEERDNVAAEFPQVVFRLTKVLEDWLAECEQLAQNLGTASLGVDEEVVERLRHLGYIS